MFLELILQNPAIAVAWGVALFFSLGFHEFSHALVAKWRGDRTAEREGRLTLNPITHIDPWGLVPLFLFGFGWAKPVPVNPYNFKNPKWDNVTVSLAGPLSNLLLSIVSAGLFRIFATGPEMTLLTAFLFFMVLVNLFLMFFNLIPVPPLDGSKLLLVLLDKPQYEGIRRFVVERGPLILMGLVLLAIVGVNIFFFISFPSYLTCAALTGENCAAFLGFLFSGG